MTSNSVEVFNIDGIRLGVSLSEDGFLNLEVMDVVRMMDDTKNVSADGNNLIVSLNVAQSAQLAERLTKYIAFATEYL